eukprot:SAG22_NODE_5043_length_1101_cov_6.185629_1_plen_92_part_10
MLPLSFYLKTAPFHAVPLSQILKLCEKMVPMLAMKTQQIILEGQVGSELYLVLKGEVEVTKDGTRLGFLSEGSFFGERKSMLNMTTNMPRYW